MRLQGMNVQPHDLDVIVQLKDLGKLRAEQFAFYPLLYVPTTERRRAQCGG